MTRHRQPLADSAFLPFGIVAAVVASAALVWTAATLAHLVNREAAPGRNPVGTLIRVVAGQHQWSQAASLWLIALVLLVVAPLAAAGIVAGRRRGWFGHRLDIDAASAHLPVERKALGRYLGEQHIDGLFDGPGVPIGHLVARGRPSPRTLRMTWEDVAVVLGGARMGKTVAVVVPAIASAPGACIVTSNKIDVYDVTRALRAAEGRIWLFDPQKLAGPEPPEWWWDPLSGVQSLADAEKLATIWADVSKTKDAKEDAFFDPWGRRVLGAMILAAAVGGKQLTEVPKWLKRPGDTSPSRILDKPYPSVATTLEAVREMPEKQRGGVIDTALKAVAWLDDPNIARWVTNPEGDREAFSPSKFVRSTDTIYLLSKEGVGSAAPLVTAFTATLLEQGEGHARDCGGRLPVPMLSVLDEAANVCRWRELPDLYSHYGSRSIVLMTVLQSWSQGVEVWGEHGMKKMCGAANLQVNLGGLTDDAFLRSLSSVCGEWEAPQRSSTTGRTAGSGSRTWSTRREPILPVGLLAALPAGRAVVVLSGHPPVVVKTEPWTMGPLAERIRAANSATMMVEQHQKEEGQAA